MQVNQPKEGGAKATTPPSDTAAPITCEQIQQYMTGGGCPTAGALGECAAMWCDGNVWTAALYIWNPAFHDSTTVAGWFRSLGASEIEITHTLYSTANGDRDGQCFEGVTRQWLVRFTMRKAPDPQAEPAPVQTEQQPVAWGAFHFGGSRSGKLYSHCETEQQIDSYIADVHRSNDSITLRKAPLYDAPIAQTAPQPEQSGWISVTDRLPEPGRSHGAGVLCWREGWLQPREMKLVSNAYAKTEKGRRPRWEETKGCLAFSEPTHWMPMPAGPAQSAQGVTHGR